MGRVALISWLLLCLFWVPSCVGPDAPTSARPVPDADALPDYRGAFLEQLAFIESKHPKYTWGGASDLGEGLDCSGYLFLAAKWAGIPGITRTTSAKMAQGLGGWDSDEIGLNDTKPGDLAFWTFKPTRLNGHVGAYASPGMGEYRAVYHASSSAGMVVKQEMSGQLKTRNSANRRLRIFASYGRHSS